MDLGISPLDRALADMKHSLDHLPEGERREMEFVFGVTREGLAKAIAHRTQRRF